MLSFIVLVPDVSELAVFVVVAAVSVHVGVRSHSFWGIHCCLGSHTMTNDRFESIIHHLVAMLLTVTWHLGCVSVKRTEGDDLFNILKNTVPTFIHKDRKPQSLRNRSAITHTNAPTFTDAQSVRDSDTFEGIVVIISVPNASFGDQDTLPPIVL